MYQLRFPEEDISRLTMQQLRGREGSRVRQVYRKASKDTGVPWNGRLYRPEDFSAGDAVNQALSAGHTCLYGITLLTVLAMPFPRICGGDPTAAVSVTPYNGFSPHMRG